MARIVPLVIAIAMAVLLEPGAADAAPGDLDTTFGTGGSVTDSTKSPGNAVVLQPDRKIVVVSDGIRVTRFDPDGALDPSFGTGGTVLTTIGAGTALGKAVALQPDGMIVVAGATGDNKFALVRYDTNGVLDPLFGTGGVVVTPIQSEAVANAVVMQSSGAIVAVGYTRLGGGSLDFALARFTSGGVLDGTFGVGGTVIMAVAGSDEIAYALLLAPGDTFVAAGFGSMGATAMRFDPDGGLDPTFGSGGIFTSAIDDFYNVTAAAFQPDGKIVLAGISSNLWFALTRVTDVGTLDTSFGGDGAVVTFFEGFSGAAAVAVESTGTIVAAGFDGFPGPGPTGGFSGDFALARYLADGALDESFGTGGKVKTQLGMSEGVRASALDGTTLVVAGSWGSSSPFGSLHLALARYKLTGPCSIVPAAGCKTPITPAKSLLQLADRTPDTSDRLQWKFRSGDATTLGDFGDPRTTEDYVLCTYDESGVDPVARVQIEIRAGGVCDGKPCWAATGTKGFKYRSKSRVPYGIESVTLTAGAAGKARITVKGKGDPLPALGLPVRVQLQASNGSCWEAVYSTAGVSKNDGAQFKGKSD